MKTKTLLKKGIFLTCLLTLLVSFSNLAYVAAEEGRIIGRTEWKKSGNMAYTVLSGTGRVHKDSTHSFHYRFEEPIVVGSELDPQYMRVHIQGLEQYHGDAGAPVLPFKPVKIAIPEGEKVVGIRVELGPAMQIPGQYLIEPTQRPVPISQMDKAKPTLPDSAIYNSDEAYPFVACGSVHLGKKGGIQIMDLNLFPAGYTSGGIIYYTDIHIHVDTIKDTGGITQFRPDQKVIDKVHAQVDNPNTLNTYIIKADYEARLEQLQTQYEYVIITTNALRDAQGEYTFQDLIAAKQQRGLTATIVTVEDDIYPNYDGTRPDGGADDQTKIRNFIIDYYQNHGTEYVLLAGDKDRIPPRLFWVESWYNGYRVTMPVDMYYGCLDGTFDNDADGVYGEPTDGENGTDVDLYAEVFIGRAAVANSDEVSNFVKKTLDYEQSRSIYLANAYMVGEYLGFGLVAEFAKDSLEEIRLGSDAHGYTTVGFENSVIDSFTTHSLYEKDRVFDTGEMWDKSELIAIMNSGVHILNHFGHANYTYDMKLRTSDLSSLTNDAGFFAYSQGCMPGGFDNPEGEECFAEVITTMENGAFAVVMNARYGWGRYNSTDGPSQRYDREFWDALLGEGIYNLGRMNQDSKEDNIGRIDESCMRWCYYELNLFGDPESAVQCGDMIGLSITSPSNAGFIRGDADIIGSAYVEETFQRYELCYAPKDTPEDTTLITSSTVSVEEGLLAVWDTDELVSGEHLVPDGEYILTLKVVDIAGREAWTSEEVIVDNYNQSPAFNITDDFVIVGRLFESKIVTDPDDPETPWGQLQISAEPLPPNAVIDNRTFLWTPTESDKGIYEVTFTVADSDYEITQTITLSTLVIQETRLTPFNDLYHFKPRIYGDKIFWMDWPKQFPIISDIYMYDIATGEKTLLVGDLPEINKFAVYENKIALDIRGLDDSLWWDVYTYDITTGQITPIAAEFSYNECDPDIYGDKIVWLDTRSVRWHIYMYDLMTGTESLVDTCGTLPGQPAIFGDRIVWASRHNQNNDIYMKDLSTGNETRITTDDSTQRTPDIFGDRIIWTDTRDFYLSIYMYDISTGEETSLTDTFRVWDDMAGSGRPKIYEDKVALIEDTIHGGRVCIYDITRGKKIRIGNPGSYLVFQYWADIYENTIVWQQTRNSNRDIYMARLFFVPQIESVSPAEVLPGDIINITGRDFGFIKGASKVLFTPDIEGIVEEGGWSDTEIICEVPEGARSGLVRVVTEGGESNGFEITIPSNKPPILEPIGDKEIDEGKLLVFTVKAEDPDGDKLSFPEPDLPKGAAFKDNGDNTATLTWEPTYYQSGKYKVTFKVTDEEFEDSETITIKVIEVDNPPEMLYLRKLYTRSQLLWAFYWLGKDGEDGYKLNYSYRVDEGSWSQPSSATHIRFSRIAQGLEEGNHILEVKAIDSRNLESGTIGIRFTIEGNTPPRILYLYHLRTFWGSYFFWLGYDKEDGYRLNYSYRIGEGEWSRPSRRYWTFTNDKDIASFSVKSIDSKGLESDVRTIILRR